MSRIVKLWRESLVRVNEKTSQSLADPKEYDNLFPGLEDALKTEQYLKPERKRLLPASVYRTVLVRMFFDFSLFLGLRKFED